MRSFLTPVSLRFLFVSHSSQNIGAGYLYFRLAEWDSYFYWLLFSRFGTRKLRVNPVKTTCTSMAARPWGCPYYTKGSLNLHVICMTTATTAWVSKQMYIKSYKCVVILQNKPFHWSFSLQLKAMFEIPYKWYWQFFYISSKAVHFKKSRAYCDSKFLSDMNKICNPLNNVLEKTACVTASFNYYNAVRSSGWLFFQDPSFDYCKESWVKKCIE